MTKNTSMKYIALGLASVALVFFAASYFVEEREKEIVSGITIEIVKQEKTLSNIAEITDRNGADAVVESIILDCPGPSRVRFDELLDRLGTLNNAELQEIDSLFNACARFFAERKAVMVARMEREFEIYKSLVDLLSVVDDAIAVQEYKITDWQELVRLEKQRSKIFSDQVDVQRTIITALRSGSLVGSEDIQRLLSDAQNITEQAVVTNQQIDGLRKKLLDV